MLRVGPTSVLLIDDEGKELGRGGQYRTGELEGLEEGGTLGVGAREVEVMGESTEKEWDALVARAKQEARELKEAKAQGKGKKKEVDMPLFLASVVAPPSPTPNTGFKPFKVPARVGANLTTLTLARSVTPGQPMFDPRREGALVLPSPPPGHPLRKEEHRMVEVVVDPFVGRHLRPHQRQGLVFLYQKVMGFTKVRMGKGEVTVQGAILADEMGLGKTLQTVALVWTMLKQSPVAGCQLAKKVLIVAPSSLLRNWEKEFRKWLGNERLTIHVAESGDKVAQFRSYSSAPILLVSYEMMVRTLADLEKVPWDLVVCDEAHRLKNSATKASTCLATLSCPRRVLLTGTPVQNDLGEFYSLVEAVCPGLLGTKASFHRGVEQVVEAGRQPGALEEEVERGRGVMEALDLATKQIVLRRTQEVINKYLPPKTVYVVFCRPSPQQAVLYSREVRASARSRASTSYHYKVLIPPPPQVSALLERVLGDPGQHLAAICRLRKLCNGPSLLQELQPGGQAASWEEQAGKLAALACVLLEMVATTDEKMVLVSLSTSTLDLLATLCARHSIPCSRLDGSTPPATRQGLVDRFNSPSSDLRVFLLSSKAGGTGLNLIGASRLVLYDLDWNPATDLQAMARVWRDGQTRHCHIYRFLTAGTIEEKMFQRQVTKSGLAVGQGEVARGQFSREELKDLFTFRGDTECETHELLQCACGGSGLLVAERQEQEVRACQLGGRQEQQQEGGRLEELAGWRHCTAPVEELVTDPVLGAASSFVSYVFSKTEEVEQGVH